MTGLRDRGVEIISCPTCSRTTVDLISIVKKVEKEIEALKLNKNMTVAILGCEVNGPGEARDADIGIAFSKNNGFIFKNGEMIKKLTPEQSIKQLIEFIQDW